MYLKKPWKIQKRTMSLCGKCVILSAGSSVRSRSLDTHLKIKNITY